MKTREELDALARRIVLAFGDHHLIDYAPDMDLDTMRRLNADRAAFLARYHADREVRPIPGVLESVYRARVEWLADLLTAELGA